jgi:superfamily II DNA or RNA helicase
MIELIVHNDMVETKNLDNMAREIFSAYVPGYKYMWQYKQGGWDGKACLIDDKNEFPTGLLPVLLDFLQERGIMYQLVDARAVPVLNNLQRTTVQLRDYQVNVIEQAFNNQYQELWWPRGVIQVATGGGKTEIAAAMTQMTNAPTLFLVHRKDLLTQTIERFKSYGIKVGELANLLTNHVTVSTVQSIYSWLKRKEKSKNVLAGLNRIEQVFVDEAHLIAARADAYNIFGEILKRMPNAYMRWGLTATPFMRDSYHNWMLQGGTGALICAITNRELIDQGYLSECKVDMVLMRKQEVPPGQRGWPECYDFYIVTNRIRNAEVARAFARYPGPTLVLVNKIAHGEILADTIGVPFLSGQSSADVRKDAIEKLKAGKLPGVVASTIWDEGIDIANIKTVILAGGGKSEIKNLQRLGRGLRIANGKQQLQLVDFIDQSPYILANHSKIRRKLWESQGFTVGMTTPK